MKFDDNHVVAQSCLSVLSQPQFQLRKNQVAEKMANCLDLSYLTVKGKSTSCTTASVCKLIIVLSQFISQASCLYSTMSKRRHSLKGMLLTAALNLQTKSFENMSCSFLD